MGSHCCSVRFTELLEQTEDDNTVHVFSAKLAFLIAFLTVDSFRRCKLSILQTMNL